eukprot:737452-Pelagomonas_calceolata.AAC.2
MSLTQVSSQIASRGSTVGHSLLHGGSRLHAYRGPLQQFAKGVPYPAFRSGGAEQHAGEHAENSEKWDMQTEVWVPSVVSICLGACRLYQIRGGTDCNLRSGVLCGHF